MIPEWTSIPLMFGIIGFCIWYCLKDATPEQLYGHTTKEADGQ